MTDVMRLSLIVMKDKIEAQIRWAEAQLMPRGVIDSLTNVVDVIDKELVGEG